jgi:uncharacterized protein (DUF3820 family)
MSEAPLQDSDELRALARTRMPFGKYAGRLLIDLPEPYLIWMIRNQLPEGLLGRRLLAIYEIQLNGLEALLAPLRPKED